MAPAGLAEIVVLVDDVPAAADCYDLDGDLVECWSPVEAMSADLSARQGVRT